MSDSPRSRLAELLRTHSLRTGTFTLASGEISDIYLDVKATSLLGEGADLIGTLFWEALLELPHLPAAVGGLTLGSDPLVTATSIAAFHRGNPLAAIIVRKATKDHGTRKALEYPPTLKPGDLVVAVDDVVTSGASTLQAIEAIRNAGFLIDHALCVVDRQASGRKALADAGVQLHSLFTLQELRQD